ncbi:MAG: TetR/AcrR family transcriptional regulator [Bifidobacteriaceae bacterium]|nr:TetR/AcrR family transcriptional regulator [Bifidobacteriaceae bacterium]
MSTPYVPPKVANHRALIEAAIRLSEERGLGRFTADELAAAAGVSRRTVFNHFDSVDQAVYEALFSGMEEILRQAVTAMHHLPPETDRLGQAFDFLERAILALDLRPAFQRLSQLLAEGADTDLTFMVWQRTVMQQIGEELSDAIVQAAPRLDRFEVTVMAGSALAACAIAYTEWASAPDVDGTALGRIVGKALHQLKKGYA